MTELHQVHLEITNRTLQMLSRCNGALVRAESESALLNEVCRIAVEIGGYRMAGVLYAMDDENKSVVPVGHAGVDDGYLDSIALSWAEDRPEGRGPAGKAIRGGQPVVVADMATDAEFSPWVGAATARGYRSGVALPLTGGGRTFGLLGLYSGEPRSVSENEQQLLREIADNLAFGILKLRADVERRLLLDAIGLVAKTAAGSTGTEYLQKLLLSLVEVLGAHAGFIAEQARPGQVMVRPLYAVLDGRLAADVEYPRDGTPCADLRPGGSLVIAREVCKRYPAAKAFAAFGSEAYVGTSLVDAAGQAIGTIFVLFLQPLAHAELAASMLDLFAASVAAELVRQKSDARLQESEARLAQSQKLESIGQLTGGIAHDFNNLLTVIIGSMESLAEELAADPKLLRLVQMAKTAGERGAELTNRLLAFARKQALEPRVLQPCAVIQEMLPLLRQTLGENIRIETAQDDEPWPVFVDPGQLAAALLNLCINARDAMPQGGSLLFETANTYIDETYCNSNLDVRPGEYVMLAIRDSGSGIAPEILDRVFDPFFTTKPAGKGTGLGLSMVYGFTKQSGGHMKIHSELDAGTVVKLYLPRAETRQPPAEQGPVADADLRGNGVILLVEDDDLVRNHAAGLLADLGYRVLQAANGAQALQIVRSDAAIDLLFTDVVMSGGMNGPHLAAEAAKLRPGVPVLFTSGYTENAIVHHNRVEPGVHLLHKPYTRRKLAEKLRGVLRHADEHRLA